MGKNDQFSGKGLNRRGLITGAGAIGVMAGLPGAARAQAKVSTPNLIKANTLVMSMNPTLPPLQFVNDRGELQGMRWELGNEIAKNLGLTP
jgi:polar amino acid transport system substrate-binding protein